MNSFIIFTWSLTFLTIFGTYLNSKQNKYGFLVWGLCNMLWLGVDFTRGIYAQAALYVVFIGFNIYGWKQWQKFIKIPRSFHDYFIPGGYDYINVHDDLVKIKAKLYRNLHEFDRNKKTFPIELTEEELGLIFDSVKYCTKVCKYDIK